MISVPFPYKDFVCGFSQNLFLLPFLLLSPKFYFENPATACKVQYQR